MKIATLNINNVNKRLANLLNWLERAEPDILCLQELKCEQTAFPAKVLREAGYESVWCGQRSWNGVAILSKGDAPILTRTVLPGDREDRQSRYVEAAVAGVIVASVYAPNGNPRPGPKFDYKLAWFERLIAHAAELLATEVPVVIAGDFNVAPTDLDIYPTRSWDDDALVQPESRAAFTRLRAQGWTDALRAIHRDRRLYTFWTYKRRRWERDAGLRLDHLMLSPQAAARLRSADVDRDVRGDENASDHAPAWIQLAEAPLPKARPATGRRRSN